MRGHVKGGKLELYVNRCAAQGVRPPAPVDAEPEWPRGVYEMEVAPKGYRAFNVVYSNGDIAFHQFPADRVTRDLIRGLKRELDVVDPPGPRIV